MKKTFMSGDRDPRNPEEQPAGDENSDEPQDGAEQSGEGGQTGGESGESATDGNYWTVVNKWKCACSEEDEDAGVTSAALWGEDDDE